MNKNYKIIGIVILIVAVGYALFVIPKFQILYVLLYIPFVSVMGALIRKINKNEN